MNILKLSKGKKSMLYVPYIEKSGKLVRIGEVMSLQELEQYIKRNYPNDIDKIVLKPLFMK